MKISNYIFYLPRANHKFHYYQPHRVKLVEQEEYLYFPKFVREITSPINHIPISPLITHITFNDTFKDPIDGRLPLSLIHLSFGYYSLFNNSVDNLPSSLTYLKVGQQFDQPIDHLPSSLLQLRLFKYNHPIDYLPSSLTSLEAENVSKFDYLPLSLKHLTISCNSEDPCLDYLPPNLTYLSFVVEMRAEYNLDHLPSSLTHLMINDWLFYNSFTDIPTAKRALDHLPSSLLYLRVGDFYDKPLDHLPSSLTYLHLGCKFNHPLDHLPPKLQELTVFNHFNHPLDHLPSSLEKLNIKICRSNMDCPDDFCQHLDHLPPSLKELKYEMENRYPYTLDHLPDRLEVLHIDDHGAEFKFLPPNITEIRSGSNARMIFPSNTKIITNFFLPLNVLPPNLTHLSFNDEYKISMILSDLPTSLQLIEFGYFFNQPVGNLPPSLVCLIFSDKFDQPIDHLPPSLKELSLGRLFNQSIDSLPSTLTHLQIGGHFGSHFNHPIDNLPSKLRFLNLGYSKFNYPVNYLPDTIQVLHLGNKFNQPLDNLPSCLKIMVVDDAYLFPLGHLRPSIRVRCNPKLPCSGIRVSHASMYKQLVFDTHKLH